MFSIGAASTSGLAAAYVSVRDVPIEVLRTSGPPQGVLAPRAAQFVSAASIARRGGHVGVGVENTNWLSQEQADRILRLGDIELAFEARRRELLPDGASRLSSLYVADGSEAGRAHIREMLGNQVFVVEVSIPAAIRVSKADTRWFDRYCETPDPQFIDQYWKSVPGPDGDPTWEYLVDGAIQVEDTASLEYIRQRGARPPGAAARAFGPGTPGAGNARRSGPAVSIGSE